MNAVLASRGGFLSLHSVAVWYIIPESQGFEMERAAKVWCYSGHVYADRPDSFLWEGKTQKVERVEKAWLGPGERHFLVQATEGLFELCYHEPTDEWFIVKPDG